MLLPKDTTLFFTRNVATRDTALWGDPDVFDPKRPIDPNKRHVAFGLGKHMCLGQYIARARLQESIHLIAQRIKDAQLEGAIGWRPFPGVWGDQGPANPFHAGPIVTRD